MKDDSCPDKSRQVRVLIISDRLLDMAKALADYLRRAEGIHVIGLAENRQQALSIAQTQAFDYLIIAGYLRVEYNYNVIAELQRQRREFLTVQWAMLDSLITGFCQRYRIPLKFDRTLPMSDFVGFLHAHKNDAVPGCRPNPRQSGSIPGDYRQSF